MAYRKKTLRLMSPTARKIARLTGELDSVSRRLKNILVDIQLLEGDSRALKNIRAQQLPGVETALKLSQATDEIEDELFNHQDDQD
jgi:hypothetical protein